MMLFYLIYKSSLKITATKPVTARHSRDFPQDTSSNSKKSISIRL